MQGIIDGPSSDKFKPVRISGNKTWKQVRPPLVSEKMAQAAAHAPAGLCTSWGIPFDIKNKVIVIKSNAFSVKTEPFKAQWVVFFHTADAVADEKEISRNSERSGRGKLGELCADYVICYADGTEVTCGIRRRHQIGMYSANWSYNCFEAVGHQKPATSTGYPRVETHDWAPWKNWLYAWENPCPAKKIAGFRFVSYSGTILISAVSYGDASSHPLRWNTREKAVLTLPEKVSFDSTLSKDGLLSQIQLDLGQVISALPRTIYPDKTWNASYGNRVPDISTR
jgi:hypothetical protein